MTKKEFFILLRQKILLQCKTNPQPEALQKEAREEKNWFAYVIKQGWMETMALSEENISRKQIAMSLHMLLQKMGEADEDQILAAMPLEDLFTCKVCTVHIAQLVQKGIMLPLAERYFGLEETVSFEEAEEILRKAFEPSLRNPADCDTMIVTDFRQITQEEAFQWIGEYNEYLLVDVRSTKEYEQGHLTEAISLPLGKLLLNPYQIAQNKSLPILLYCDHGEQSRMGAKLLSDAGYLNICYFAWEVH